MPLAEARGGMATAYRGVPRRAPVLRSNPSCGGWKAGLASAEFRLALPQMPRAEARGASLDAESMHKTLGINEEKGGLP